MPVKVKHSPKLFDLLEENYLRFNQLEFIEEDPILIPHSFSLNQDIEISGFLSAIIAWGQRKTIINNAKKMMLLMDNAPYEFILKHQESDLKRFEGFVHRTFNSDDLLYFIHALKAIYRKHDSLEVIFLNGKDMKERISNFKTAFFNLEHLKRTEKHLADPLKGSSAKRINMFLRWMVRKDEQGVDFGIWNKIQSSDLMIPLDVHTGNTARKLGLLSRKQNDWKSVEELTSNLKLYSKEDPVKYDFSLFGLGVNSLV